jgi:hypothetical protein
VLAKKKIPRKQMAKKQPPRNQQPHFEIGDQHVCRFVCSGTTVVQKQEQRVLFEPLPCTEAGRRQDDIHLLFLQVGHQRPGRPLRRDRTYLAAPCHVFGTVQADEVRQRVDCRQTLVARRHGTTTLLLQILQEQMHAVCREIINAELVDRTPTASPTPGTISHCSCSLPKNRASSAVTASAMDLTSNPAASSVCTTEPRTWLRVSGNHVSVAGGVGIWSSSPHVT